MLMDILTVRKSESAAATAADRAGKERKIRGTKSDCGFCASLQIFCFRNISCKKALTNNTFYDIIYT
ncbi:MAG TPA: hypothetical protein DEP65_01840 [Ruminococcus sp.]|nr:hypothetical protein [Ruminococcus sp.]